MDGMVYLEPVISKQAGSSQR